MRIWVVAVLLLVLPVSFESATVIEMVRVAVLVLLERKTTDCRAA